MHKLTDYISSYYMQMYPYYVWKSTDRMRGVLLSYFNFVVRK